MKLTIQEKIALKKLSAMKYRGFKKKKWQWPSGTTARSKQYDKNGDCHPFIRLKGIPKLSLRGRIQWRKYND